jgi:hypothetical protein
MNCKQCQEGVLESLAAGETFLAPELNAHQISCALCREFHLAQQGLFHSVDAGLHSIANQPVPLSLLPGLRLRLEEHPAPLRAWFSGWSLAFVVAAVVFTLVSAYLLRRHDAGPHSTEFAAIPRQPLDKPRAALPTDSKPPVGAMKATITSIHRPKPVPSEQEVIVLAEECQAFSNYLAAAPVQAEVPVVPVSPVQPVTADSAEIALLTIESLEVPSLEGAVDE